MEWRQVPSLPHAEASDEGQIRWRYWSGYRWYAGGPTLGVWTGTRYIVLIQRHTRKVARLVCEAFHGPAPPDRPYCLHGDENARNNRPENLRWGTQQENLNAPGFLEYCRGRTGERNPYVKGRSRRPHD